MLKNIGQAVKYVHIVLNEIRNLFPLFFGYCMVTDSQIFRIGPHGQTLWICQNSYKPASGNSDYFGDQLHSCEVACLRPRRLNWRCHPSNRDGSFLSAGAQLFSHSKNRIWFLPRRRISPVLSKCRPIVVKWVNLLPVVIHIMLWNWPIYSCWGNTNRQTSTYYCCRWIYSTRFQFSQQH